MPNVCLTISYDGTNYAGWQIQKNAKTIQSEIEKALKKILKEKVRVIASGRTDAGVHAKGQIANFKTNRNFHLKNLTSALNKNLPKDISITKAKKVSSKFHSQYDAKSKLYRYTILNSNTDDPFMRPYYLKVRYELDFPLMREEAKTLVGKHDFKSFQAKSSTSPIKNTVRTIKKLTLRKEKDFVIIDIEANGFLHHMVRNIVGSLIEIGRGYLTKGSLKKILISKNRKKAGPTASAKGLMLIKVTY